MAFISKICNVSKAIDILLVSDNKESDSFEISGSSDEDSRISGSQQESEKGEGEIEFEFIVLIFCSFGHIDNV